MLLRRMPQFGYLVLVSSICAGMLQSPLLALPIGGTTDAPAQQYEIGIGGCGGVYFLAAPGELVIDLYKRDRNRRGRTTELRAILVGPDRQVLSEVRIPTMASRVAAVWGRCKQARLSTRVDHPGVYALNITVSQDRYGDSIVWGFRTNCPKYLIETSRGHRDRRREEPIVLLNPGRPGSVCFVPPRRAFSIDISGLPRDVKQLPVFDANDQLVHTLEANDKGQASHSFAADADRGDRTLATGTSFPASNDPYRRRHSLDVRRPDSKICRIGPPIETATSPSSNTAGSLTPYRRVVFGQPGEQRELEFHSPQQLTAQRDHPTGGRIRQPSVSTRRLGKFVCNESESAVSTFRSGHAHLLGSRFWKRAGLPCACNTREQPRFLNLRQPDRQVRHSAGHRTAQHPADAQAVPT